MISDERLAQIRSIFSCSTLVTELFVEINALRKVVNAVRSCGEWAPIDLRIALQELDDYSEGTKYE